MGAGAGAGGAARVMWVLVLAPVRVTAVALVLDTVPARVRLLVAKVTAGLVRVTLPRMLTDWAWRRPEMVVCVPAATDRL